MISFLILVLTNYDKWEDNESTNFITQTKQKSEEWEDDRLFHLSNQAHPINVLSTYQSIAIN
jgi:hypothetical protein